jgi:hypothetical protein
MAVVDEYGLPASRASDASGSGWVGAFAFLLLGAFLAVGASTLPSNDAGAVAPVTVVVFGGTPEDALAVVAAADGLVLTNAPILGGVVAISDEPHFASRLYRAGASLVLRAGGRFGCGGKR